MEGPPVWMVLWMPYLRAQRPSCAPVGPSLTPPRPTLAEQLHAGVGQVLEVLLDHALFDDRRAGMHLHAAGPEGSRMRAVRKIAMAFRPTTSLGRPGMCTSPAEIMVVTPP
jgi:hypothetical protein